MSLDFSEFPDHFDPHRCGTAPFVPAFDGERQHSCGSYSAAFDENGCNKYRPNYPDDLYLLEHGCADLADCHNGVPPSADGKLPPQPRSAGRWPAGGFEPTVVQGKNLGMLEESFSDDGGGLLKGVVWVVVLYLLLKYLTSTK